MPELPEVEASRKQVYEHCLGKRIVTVSLDECGGGPRDGLFDEIVYGETEDENGDVTNVSTRRDQYIASLQDKVILDSRRKGKHLWITTNSGPHVLFHFGMTGSFVIDGQDITSYKSFKISASSWPPKFTKLSVTFEDGMKLAFCDPRRLSRIRLSETEPSLCPPISLLAKDPLLDSLVVCDLQSVTSSTSAPIKSVLLDQAAYVCGIGNWVADEVLYHSGIHPATSAKLLTKSHLEALIHSIGYVIRTAVNVNADSTKFPDDWLFHCRWEKGKKAKSEILKLPNGNVVTFETVAGRTSAIVPQLQKKITGAITVKAVPPSTSTISKSGKRSSKAVDSIDIKRSSKRIKR